MRFPSRCSAVLAAAIFATSAPYSSLRSKSLRTCSSCAGVLKLNSAVVANPPAALTADSTSVRAGACDTRMRMVEFPVGRLVSKA